MLRPAELTADWDPTTDKRLTVWEMVHQLISVLEANGEAAAATLVANLGSQAETGRELCYRRYALCERKKRAAEANKCRFRLRPFTSPCSGTLPSHSTPLSLYSGYRGKLMRSHSSKKNAHAAGP